MSIFERNSLRKVYLDDSYELKATIICSENIQGHTEYVIRVKREFLSFTWLVNRRYNDFLSLNNAILSSGLNLSFPPKKIIGNMDRNFVAVRQILLQNYLDKILKHPLLASQLVIKKFLDPHNYNSYQELGLSGITIGIRDEVGLRIIKQLPRIGTRLRKENYLVKLKNDSKQEMILTWIPFGPNIAHDQKDILVLLKMLTRLQHVNIANLIKAGICNDGIWIVKDIRKNGTILDEICGCTKMPWMETALKKYSNLKIRKSISLNKIIDIVSQILKVLAFLHHKGMPYGNLHNGNIVYEDGLVKLLDIENSIIGIPCYYRNILTKIKQIQSMQSLDIYCLGLAIYEMATSVPFSLENPNFDAIPIELRPILLAILSNKDNKNNFPTMADLFNIDLFKNNTILPQPHIKLTTMAKQYFVECSEKFLETIKNDYSRYRKERRVLKLCENLEENEGQILICYKKKVQNSVAEEEDINGNHGQERSTSPSSNNSNTNTILSTTSAPQVPISIPIADGRQALLGAICNFNKENLRKTNKSV